MPAPKSHLSEFLGAVERRFKVDDSESFWECEPAFQALLNSPAAREAINADLKRLSDAPGYSGDWSPTELVLHRGGGTVLVLSLSAARRRYLHVLPYHAMYAVLGDGGIAYNKHGVPATFREDLFDPNLRLGPGESGFLRHGETLRLPCGKFAFDFNIEQPVLMLRFVTTAILPLEWLFNRDTLQAWQANDSDLSFTQLRVAADVLGKMAHQSSIKALKLMSGHGHHAVRWAAITNLGRINRSEAIVKLKDAMNDPHPHVRNAAQKTLKKLGL